MHVHAVLAVDGRDAAVLFEAVLVSSKFNESCEACNKVTVSVDYLTRHDAPTNWLETRRLSSLSF